MSVCLQCGRPRFDPWVGKIPWRRKWKPTPVFLPRKFHGWRSLVSYSPWGRKESNTTEPLRFTSIYLFIHSFLNMRPCVGSRWAGGKARCGLRPYRSSNPLREQRTLERTTPISVKWLQCYMLKRRGFPEAPQPIHR